MEILIFLKFDNANLSAKNFYARHKRRKFMEAFIGHVNDALYGYVLIILLVVGGIYFTIRTKGAQFNIAKQIGAVIGKPSDGKKVSSFQALMVSTASRVGTGNIIGVTTAIMVGGFGSVFWMWVIALIGGASALVESTLAQIFKTKTEKGFVGGPAYYIEKGLGKKWKWLAVLFSVLLILTYAVGFNMLCSYNLQSTFATYEFYGTLTVNGYNFMPWVIGFIIAVLVAICILGGGKGIIKVTSFLVPFMGVAYILVAIVVTCMHITALPSVIAQIFAGAFDFNAIFGGFMGSCIMHGVKRGLYSNEAGIGSAPNAAATADVSHPVKQGLVQTLSVFIDTILICSATAFMCMTSGVNPAPFGDNAAGYIQTALSVSLGGFGPIFITIAMVLFAFTTLVGNLYYVDQAVYHLLGRTPSKAFTIVYRILSALLVFVGSGLSVSLLWGIADVTMGLMALINIPVIAVLGKYAYKAISDYNKQKKEKKEPVFTPSTIGLSNLDGWQESPVNDVKLEQ